MRDVVDAIKDFFRRKFDALKAKVKALRDSLVERIKGLD